MHLSEPTLEQSSDFHFWGAHLAAI